MTRRLYPLAALTLFSFIFWGLTASQINSEPFQKVLLSTRDLFFKIRLVSAAPPDAARELLIVSIDEESCEELGERWPWSRKILARLLEELHKRGARVIGFNLSFTGREESSDASTEAFAAAAQAHGAVVVGASFDRQGRVIPPHGVIASSVARYGYLEKILDADTVIRRSHLARLYVNAAGEYSKLFESSFPLQLASIYRQSPATYEKSAIVLKGGAAEIPVDGAGAYAINYSVRMRDLERVPAWKILAGKVPPGKVKGKAVLVGLTSSLFADTHRTPLGLIPGVAIHANEFLAIASGRPLRFLPIAAVLWISFFPAIGIFALFLTRRFWAGFLSVLAASGIVFVAAQAALYRDIVAEPFLLLLGPILAGLAGCLIYVSHLLWDNRGLEMKIIRDKMTGLYTYDYLRSRLQAEWSASLKNGRAVSVAMTDLDRFKKINDTLGHEVGNQMILRAAAVIRESARGSDVVARYGGDEFVILLGRTGAGEAENYRLRLRELYHRMAAGLEPALKDSSISIGVATFDPSAGGPRPASPQELIEWADKNLFEDKQKRRKPV